MFELPEGIGDIQIVEREKLADWQALGWKPIGIVTETAVEGVEQLSKCPGAVDDCPCEHGWYGEGQCSIPSITITQVPMARARIVLVQDTDSTIQGLRQEIANITSEGHAFAATLLEVQEQAAKHRQRVKDLEGQVKRSDIRDEGASNSIQTLRKTNRELHRQHQDVIDENDKLRANIHTTAMAQVLGARELVRTGGWIHPLAFVCMLDSLDQLTCTPEDYVRVIKTFCESGVIEVQVSRSGRRLVRVKNERSFFETLQEMDATRRLSGKGQEKEDAEAF